jgi:uncharacterized protein YjbK
MFGFTIIKEKELKSLREYAKQCEETIRVHKQKNKRLEADIACLRQQNSSLRVKYNKMQFLLSHPAKRK